jgi:hypothetical protein
MITSRSEKLLPRSQHGGTGHFCANRGRPDTASAGTNSSTSENTMEQSDMTSSTSDRQFDRREVAQRCANNNIPVGPMHGTKDGVCTCDDEDCPTPGDHARATATTDPAVINEYWEKWPKAKLALATGAPDIIAVKLKLTGVGRPDEPWSRRPDKWAELEKKFGVPRTVSFSSKDEDVLLFTVPKEDVPIGTLEVAEGITVCGVGEYVLLPQNFSSTGKLAFRQTCAPGDVPIAPAPDLLSRMINFTLLNDENISFNTRMIPFDMIAPTECELDPERVKLYAESLQVTNVRTLLYVRWAKEYYFILLSDPYELAALEQHGLTSAQGVILHMDDIDAELWKIAQVLTQPKLSVLDWAEAIMRWVDLVKLKDAQGARPLGGHQPHDKGFSRTGRVVGVSRRDVERASVINSICAEAKAEIRKLNLNVKRKLLAIGAEPEELQLRKLYELTRDLKSESAAETDIPNGSEPGDGGQQHEEADQEPGESPAEEADDKATPDAAMGKEETITLNGPGDSGGRSEGDQEPGGPGPVEAVTNGPVTPAMAAKGLIASPSITPGADGDSPAADLSQDFDALESALDQAWDQHSAPIYDTLSDERRRHFIARKLGYVAVAADDVAEPGPKADDADS